MGKFTELRKQPFKRSCESVGRAQGGCNSRRPGSEPSDSGNDLRLPARPAQVILKVVRMDDPPIRLLLGSDALKIVETADARKARGRSQVERA